MRYLTARTVTRFSAKIRFVRWHKIISKACLGTRPRKIRCSRSILPDISKPLRVNTLSKIVKSFCKWREKKRTWNSTYCLRGPRRPAHNKRAHAVTWAFYLLSCVLEIPRFLRQDSKRMLQMILLKYRKNTFSF